MSHYETLSYKAFFFHLLSSNLHETPHVLLHRQKIKTFRFHPFCEKKKHSSSLLPPWRMFLNEAGWRFPPLPELRMLSPWQPPTLKMHVASRDRSAPYESRGAERSLPAEFLSTRNALCSLLPALSSFRVAQHRSPPFASFFLFFFLKVNMIVCSNNNEKHQEIDLTQLPLVQVSLFLAFLLYWRTNAGFLILEL